MRSITPRMDRMIMIRMYMPGLGKIIFVVSAFEDHGVIKLISARSASAPEKERYELGEDVF